MPSVRNRQGLRIDNLVNLGYSFTPSLAMSAKAFDKMGLDIRSFRVPLKRAIQQVIAPSIGQNFLANGRPDQWMPYSDQTTTMKMNDPKNRYGEGDILRRSGLLWKTMQQYNIWTVTENQAAILTLPEKVWYGAIHQAGYGIRASSVTEGAGGGGAFLSPKQLKEAGGSAKTYIPARPFAMFQSQDIDKVQEIFADWVLERASANLAIRSRAMVR
jgi:phage gpG-like protein